MANSPGSAQRRAHLIREMAKPNERSHSRNSAASSVQSALQGAHYDTDSQQLPVMRPEADFQINTSALRRAFPDFSQYGSSEEDSIELGRGGKQINRNIPGNIPPSADVSENLSLDLGAAGLYRITGTPPIKPRDKDMKSNPSVFNVVKNNGSIRRTTSTKDNEDPLVKTTDFVSGSSNKGSSKGSHNGHRSLAELHARVDSDDSVVLSDRHRPTVSANTKNTRFNSRRTQQLSNLTNADSSLINGQDNSDRGLSRDQNQEQGMQNLTNTSNASAGNGTHQSYMLPDIANITELVSGVRQDGTPQLSRSAKARSRFGTPSQIRRSSALKQAHIPIEAVPIPADQQALTLCLQLLQEKVAELERGKEKSEKALDEYELEVLQLRSKLEEQQLDLSRNSEQLGFGKGNARDWKNEKSALENSMKALQDRLDRANRKLSASEVTISNLTKDRHAAHQQLEVAHSDSEELKSESQAVRHEIESVKRQVARLTREHEDRIEQLTSQETELRAKIERREQAIKEMGCLANDLWATRRLLAESKASGGEIRVMSQQVENATQSGSSFSKPMPLVRPATTVYKTTSSQHDFNDSTMGQLSDMQSTTDIREPTLSQMVQSSPKNATYLSFMDGDEIPKLRQLLKEDKALLAESNGRAAPSNAQDVQETSHCASNRIGSQNLTMPRKSSLKRTVKDEDAIKIATNDPAPHRNQVVQGSNPLPNSARPMVSFPVSKEDTQRSIQSQRSERPRRSTSGVSSEMTSAFILPDITLTGDASVLCVNGSTTTSKTAKQSVTVPRPLPVSDRMPLPARGEEDATIRPAQPPGLALATVLKGLEDELAQLRAQLARQEALYNQHDPSLSKRKRKVVLAKIQKLLAIIDMRADQIYALYDVLEGQKDKGQLMPEEEVEVTLQSIGIDAVTARSVSEGQTKNSRASGAIENLNSDDEDGSGNGSDNGRDELDDLPWEGFEATHTQTLGSLRSLSRAR